MTVHALLPLIQTNTYSSKILRLITSFVSKLYKSSRKLRVKTLINTVLTRLSIEPMMTFNIYVPVLFVVLSVVERSLTEKECCGTVNYDITIGGGACAAGEDDCDCADLE